MWDHDERYTRAMTTLAAAKRTTKPRRTDEWHDLRERLTAKLQLIAAVACQAQRRPPEITLELIAQLRAHLDQADAMAREFAKS